jgi:GNAT superfamily N-acetyltransferase
LLAFLYQIDLERDGFESNPVKFRCLVVENNTTGTDGGTLCGYALYFPTYSTWEGSALRLEDIYISPAHRKTGLGRALLANLAKVSDKNYSRTCFRTLSERSALH